jgi:hypothetical protein
MRRCPYCDSDPILYRLGEQGYPYGKDYGPVWTCVPCGAWVGCHPGMDKPLGRLADTELRRAKMRAHVFFDPIWQEEIKRTHCTKSHARRKAYEWLSVQMDIPSAHIGNMDVDECRKVVQLCKVRLGVPSDNASS